MTLSELSQDEQLALVALIKATVMADGHVSEDELDELAAVVEDLGQERYQTLLDKVDEQFETDAQVKKFLKTITNKESQELIYGTVMELAMTDAVLAEEDELLSWLADAWGIEVSFEGEGEGDPDSDDDVS